MSVIKDKIVKIWEIASDTTSDVYSVALLKDGSYRCTCPARTECKHIKRVRQGDEKIEFEGYSLHLQHLRTDKSTRVTIETSLDQYDRIKDIPKLIEGIYTITIKRKT